VDMMFPDGIQEGDAIISEGKNVDNILLGCF